MKKSIINLEVTCEIYGAASLLLLTFYSYRSTKSKITNYKLLINLESAVYLLKCRKSKSENCSMEVTRLHHIYTSGIQQQKNITIERKLRSQM